ncbi:MAG: hypothetical protein WBB94_02710 [Candidatus Saccharimonadaceae bacterium]
MSERFNTSEPRLRGFNASQAFSETGTAVEVAQRKETRTTKDGEQIEAIVSTLEHSGTGQRVDMDMDLVDDAIGRDERRRDKRVVGLMGDQAIGLSGFLPVESRVHISKLLNDEFDDGAIDGVIVRLPDWVKNSIQDTDKEVPVQQSPEERALEMFRSFKTDFIRSVDLAIGNAGHSDPHAAVGSLAYRIHELIRTSPSMTTEMITYLNKVVAVCVEVRDSGRNSRAQYYGDKARSGLQKIRRMIDDIRV